MTSANEMFLLSSSCQSKIKGRWGIQKKCWVDVVKEVTQGAWDE